jgi:hypothetical protein
METAKRHPPGVLHTPNEAGAVAVPVCRLSGLRATPSCARLTEWFAPGTAPTQLDDWERDGRVSLPDEYAEWSRQEQRAVGGVTLAGGPADADRTRLGAERHANVGEGSTVIEGLPCRLPPGR